MSDGLLISFSGGETSAYMTHRIFSSELFANIEKQVVFANTGQENEETLDFVKKCDDEFGFNTTWVEAVTQPGRVACTHKIVTFETASRNGEPFKAMIEKYGLPNKSYPHCTRELKLHPIRSFMGSLGWFDYMTAVGIRVDEPGRIAKTAKANNIIYPFNDVWPTDKQDVRDFWDDQLFKLELKEYQGNCKWCFKKSTKKHIRIIRENPEFFKFPREMEQLHGFTGNGSDIRDKGRRVIFREHRNTDMLFKLAGVFGEVHDDNDDGCSQSCEPDFTKLHEGVDRC